MWLVDGRGYQRWVRPAVILGMNAIAVYMASELIDTVLASIHWTEGTAQMSLRLWIYTHLFAPLASPINASLLYAIAYVLLMYAIAYGMYRRKWFVRV